MAKARTADVAFEQTREITGSLHFKNVLKGEWRFDICRRVNHFAQKIRARLGRLRRDVQTEDN